MEPLGYLQRPADGEAGGLLVVHHGRGTDERDLIGLADALDPGRRLHVVAPRAPLSLPGLPGYHWYVVPEVGRPDFETFHAARGALAELHDALWAETATDPAHTVLGGFSMGAVMSYAMALGGDRPPVAGILAFSGFMPAVERWQPDFENRRTTGAFVAHGRRDAIIGVEFGRRAREQLEAGGLPVEYHESERGHEIDPAHLSAAIEWLEGRLPAEPRAG